MRSDRCRCSVRKASCFQCSRCHITVTIAYGKPNSTSRQHAWTKLTNCKQKTQHSQHLNPVVPEPRRGMGYSQKRWVGVCGLLPKTLTLFMTKICDIPYLIYDPTKNSKPNLWPDPPIKILFQTCVIISSVVLTNFRLLKHNLRRAFVDFLFATVNL